MNIQKRKKEVDTIQRDSINKIYNMPIMYYKYTMFLASLNVSRLENNKGGEKKLAMEIILEDQIHEIMKHWEELSSRTIFLSLLIQSSFLIFLSLYLRLHNDE